MRNGSKVGGRAGVIAQALIAKGYSSKTSAATGTDTAHSTVSYAPGLEADAREVATSMGLPATAVEAGTGPGVTLTIGTDWTTGTAFTGGTGASPVAPAPADTHAALTDANSQTADDTSKCAQVGHQDTVSINGVGMTPVKAYDRSPDVQDSAP